MSQGMTGTVRKTDHWLRCWRQPAGVPETLDGEKTLEGLKCLFCIAKGLMEL